MYASVKGSLPPRAVRALRRLAARRDAVLEERVRPWILRRRVEHVSGPATVEYGEDEALLISVVRNGAVHLRPFLEHHFRLGVAHVVLLDNGSTDGTVEIAREHDRVTVLRTDCPYRSYENVMKRYLARRFSRNRWNLCVDVDERFDYPGSDAVPLPALLRYLNGRGYTAVVAQMLDMFPDCTLAELERADGGDPEASHVFYDTANVRRTEYPFGTASHPGVRMHWDGIRNTLFGSEQGLTKAALARADEGAELFVYWHHVPEARLADFTAVLLHYPFAGSFREKVRDAVETLRYGGFSVKDYARFWAVLQQGPETPFRQPTSRRWGGVERLLDEGFLVASPEYRALVDGRRAALRPAEAGEAARG